MQKLAQQGRLRRGSNAAVCGACLRRHGASALMSQCVDELAAQYPRTKFVRIVSTDCIPKVRAVRTVCGEQTTPYYVTHDGKGAAPQVAALGSSAGVLVACFALHLVQPLSGKQRCVRVRRALCTLRSTPTRTSPRCWSTTRGSASSTWWGSRPLGASTPRPNVSEKGCVTLATVRIVSRLSKAPRPGSSTC